MEGTLQESRNVEHILILLWLAQGAGEEVSCLKMNKVNNLHHGTNHTAKGEPKEGIRAS